MSRISGSIAFNVSQVGLRLDGNKVDGIVAGSSAFLSDQLDLGDTILELNGSVVVAAENLPANKSTGMKVVVKFQKCAVTAEMNQVREVSLIKMPSEILATRSRLFSLLNVIKVAFAVVFRIFWKNEKDSSMYRKM